MKFSFMNFKIPCRNDKKMFYYLFLEDLFIAEFYKE